MALSIITLGQHKRDDIYGIIPSTGEFCELFMDNGDDNNQLQQVADSIVHDSIKPWALYFKNDKFIKIFCWSKMFALNWNISRVNGYFE